MAQLTHYYNSIISSRGLNKWTVSVPSSRKSTSLSSVTVVMAELVSNNGLRGERLRLGDAFGRAQKQASTKRGPHCPTITGTSRQQPIKG